MDRWSGRVAMVTGASSGIGAAIARALVQNGMKVVGVARRPALVQTLAEELKKEKASGELHAVQCDVGVEEEVKKAFLWTKDKLGGVDVLVNNAGVAPLTPLSELDTGKMKKIFDTNVIGLCLFTNEAIQDMKSRGVDDGHIIHISSIAGHSLQYHPGGGLYAASKHSVRVLTEFLRKELATLKSKIRVTSVSPGLVDTDIFRASDFPVEVQEALVKENPVLKGEDIANAVLYALASPPHVQVHEITVHPTGETF